MQNVGLILSSILMLLGIWGMLGKTQYPPVFGGVLLLIGFGLVMMIIMFTMKDKRRKPPK